MAKIENEVARADHVIEKINIAATKRVQEILALVFDPVVILFAKVTLSPPQLLFQFCPLGLGKIGAFQGLPQSKAELRELDVVQVQSA